MLRRQRARQRLRQVVDAPPSRRNRRSRCSPSPSRAATDDTLTTSPSPLPGRPRAAGATRAPPRTARVRWWRGYGRPAPSSRASRSPCGTKPRGARAVDQDVGSGRRRSSPLAAPRFASAALSVTGAGSASVAAPWPRPAGEAASVGRLVRRAVEADHDTRAVGRAVHAQIAAPRPPAPPVTTRHLALAVAAHADVGLLAMAGEALRARTGASSIRRSGRGLVGQHPLIGAGLDELADPQAAGIARRLGWSAACGWCRSPCRHRDIGACTEEQRAVVGHVLQEVIGSAVITWTCSEAISSASCTISSSSSHRMISPYSSQATRAIGAVGRMASSRSISAGSPRELRGGGQQDRRGFGPCSAWPSRSVATPIRHRRCRRR
jgi:hypothetical protein